MEAKRRTTRIRPTTGLLIVAVLMAMGRSEIEAGEAIPTLQELKLKAEAGEGAAQLALAMRYDGQDLPEEKNLDQAYRWYKAAASKGYAEAQSSLALFYMKGEGTKIDFAEGARWFRQAAEQGHPVAQLNLASCYANGHGVERSIVEAAKWFRESAERNEPMAQYYLGLLYGRGEGVAQSYVEAYKWLTAAAAQGVEEARQSLETLDSVLGAKELEAAKKAAAGMRLSLVGR